MSEVTLDKRNLKNKLIDEKEPSLTEEDSKLQISTKSKKGPLPMKLRALPQSFWQQPNTLAEVPPTTYHPLLDEEREETSRSEVIGVANTELLFSLFHSVEDVGHEEVKLKQLPLVRRGRPRKHKNNFKTNLKVKKDADPYFTSATVPCIQLQDDEKLAQRQQVLALISLTGENSNFSVSDSYSERLSNLVVNL